MLMYPSQLGKHQEDGLGDRHGPPGTHWLSCSNTSANDEFCLFNEPEGANFLRFGTGSTAISALALFCMRVWV